MVIFNKKSELLVYLEKVSPRDGKYIVDNDETLQNKKSIYSYVNNELILESGITEINWLPTVDTYAELLAIVSPYGLDSAIVEHDETHNGNRTWYKHNGYDWKYMGAYHKREAQTYFSGKDTRVDIITGNITLPFDYIVGCNELDLFIDGNLATQHIIEVGDLGFTSKSIGFNIDIPVSADFTVKKVVPNIDAEPRTNDEMYINAFMHNYGAIEKFIKYEKSEVINYPTFADAMNDTLLNKENQVIRTLGHTTKNDGKGRYWILESTDKDFAFKTKSGNYFINRLIGADEKQIGEIFPLAGNETAPPESVIGSGQLVNRNDFKRIWNWALATGRVVTEAEWATNPGCFSSGNLTTTFRFPNFTDMFIRAKKAGANVGLYVVDSFKSHGHSLSTDGAHVHGLTMGGDGAGDRTVPQSSGNLTWAARAGVIGSAGSHTHTLGSAGGTETTPKHIYEQYFIKI